MTSLRAYGAARSAASSQVHDRPTTKTTPIEDGAAMIIARFVESARRAALRLDPYDSHCGRRVICPGGNSSFEIRGPLIKRTGKVN